MTVRITRPVIKQCPYRDETDAGELVITLPGAVPELHTFAAIVDELSAKPISHEAFTQAIAQRLPPDATVGTTWHTGPWTVEVTEGSSCCTSEHRPAPTSARP